MFISFCYWFNNGFAKDKAGPNRVEILYNPRVFLRYRRTLKSFWPFVTIQNRPHYRTLLLSCGLYAFIYRYQDVTVDQSS